MRYPARSLSAAVTPTSPPIKPTPSWGDRPSSRYSKTLGCLWESVARVALGTETAEMAASSDLLSAEEQELKATSERKAREL